MNVVNYFLNNDRYLSLFGIGVILAVALLFSNNKKKIRLKLVLSALGMQFLLTYCILKTTIGELIFFKIAQGFEALYRFADAGSQFVFGNLATDGPWGMVFAIRVLPTIIFFGALIAVLVHLGIIQVIVKSLAMFIRPIFGISGAETLSVTANSMLGQTEAPLLIKNYLAKMTDSEMLLVMVGGMSHLSASLLAVYGSMGVSILHLLTSSIIAIPGSILIAKILIPETEVPETLNGGAIAKPPTKNVLDAISTGTSDGLSLAVNVGAMLIAFISLIALADSVLLSLVGYSLNELFGKIFYWVAYVVGIPLQDREAAGVLLGQKLVINEFVAYSSFVLNNLTERSQVIMTYALAGFSNFSCIGIQIGGIGALCPEKRHTLTRLGMKALLGGSLVNLLNAAIVGLFI